MPDQTIIVTERPESIVITEKERVVVSTGGNPTTVQVRGAVDC